MTKGYVLSLCDRSGKMVLPWLVDGYDAVTIDLQKAGDLPENLSGKHTHISDDISGTIGYETIMARGKPLAIFAFPPCTHLASSGSRWWAEKGLDGLIDGLRLVSSCIRLCEAVGVPYVIENPIGSLSTYWRKPDHVFDPCDLAGYAPDPGAEAYTKRTCYWIGGGFRMPRARRVEPVLGSRMHDLGESTGRANVRSETPLGLAYGAFFFNEPRHRQMRDDLEPARA